MPDVLRHANGDGKLDASDPAFAAIKLWVDVNHNGRMDAGESTGLQSIQLTSIDLNHGTLNYADGQSDQLSTTTLSADTEGVKLDTVKVVGADGKLKELDAGELIVHEHYDGKTRMVSYELQAKVTGDWEGTAYAAAKEGMKACRSKLIRSKMRYSPRQICVNSYENSSNRGSRQHRGRVSLHQVRNRLSPVSGMYGECFGGQAVASLRKVPNTQAEFSAPEHEENLVALDSANVSIARFGE